MIPPDRDRGCIRGRDLILGPFGDADAHFGEAMERLLRRTGGSSADTLRGWITLRQTLAVYLALAHLVERGEVEVTGWDADADALWRAHPHARAAAAGR
jgi:hypothetical protein